MSTQRSHTPLPPPLLFHEVCLLSLAAGIIACTYPVPTFTAWAIGLWADGRARNLRLLTLCACCLLGMGIGWWSMPVTPVSPDWVGSETSLRGTVAGVRALPEQRLRIMLRDVAPEQGGETLPGLLAVTWQNASQTVLNGQTLRAAMKIRPVGGFRNEYGSDIDAYWKRQNIFHTAYLSGTRTPVAVEGEGKWLARARSLWRSRLDVLIKKLDMERLPGLALIPALLYADQRNLSLETLERVTAAGLRHSFALSGQHLAVVAFMALLPVLLLERLFPSLLILGGRRLFVATVSLPLTGVCLWLGDAPSSLVRAALMLCIWVILQWRARPTTLMDGLCMALACMMAADSLCLFDLGVQLSFLAVAGIAVFQPLWTRAVMPRLPVCTGWNHHIARVPRGILWAICLSCAAQVFSLPIVLHAFGRITPGLLYNVLWLPVLGVVVLPFAWLAQVLAVLGIDRAAEVCLYIAALPGSWLLALLNFADTHEWLTSVWSLRPHWTAMIGYGALLIGLVALYGQATRNAARKLALAGAVLILAGPGLRLTDALREEVSLYVADVGQGQGIILEWPGGRGVIDGGGFASSRLDSGRDLLAPVLTANRSPRLNFVSASHMDRDHIGGLFFLLEHFSVPLYLAGASLPEDGDGESRKTDHDRLEYVLHKNNIPRLNLISGERYRLTEDTWLEVLWPPKGHLLKGNNSLVLRLVRNNEGLALFTGDLEPKVQKALLRLHAPENIQAKVLLLPHHGSRRNLEPDLYTAVRPDIAIASAGAGNRWGFPSQEVRRELARFNIPLYTTADHGGLRIRFENGSLIVRGARNPDLSSLLK